MPTLDFGFAALEQELWRLVFLMVRVGAALAAAPFFGAAAVPMMARLGVTSAIAVFVAAWLPITVPEALISAQGILAIAGEILIGLALGFVLTLAFVAPTVAAEMIGGAMGMSMAVSRDPASGVQISSIGQYFSIVLTLIFLAIGGHLHFLALLCESYRVFPPGETWLGAEQIARVPQFASFMFEIALRIALPVTLVLLLVQVVTGILSRSAPSLNLFALGLPAGVMAGIAALILAAPVIFEQLELIVERGLERTERIIEPRAITARPSLRGAR